MEDVVKLLVVDDDEAIRSFFAEIFSEEDFSVTCVEDGESAVKRMARTPFDLVVTDLCMPRMDGIRLIREIQRLAPTTTVVAITGYGTIKDAVSLMKHGAYDVLAKPFSLDEIRLTIEKAVRHHRLARKNRELEHRLKTAEKLAVIGKLAAGVAHEINSPLDGVIRFVNLSLDQRNDPDAVDRYLADARAGLDRIANIVRSLLDFSRSIVRESEPQPLGDLIREAVDQLRHRTSAPEVRIHYDLSADTVAVPGEYMHVFTNLVKNALDAMPEGGRLDVASRLTGAEIEVTIADTGPGIPEALREKVFEPFFTTKKLGRGTGLGLSICRQIVERQGGRISLIGGAGPGSTFVVTFLKAPESATSPGLGPTTPEETDVSPEPEANPAPVSNDAE